MSSSTTSLKRRFSSSEDKENLQQIDSKDIHDQQAIRSSIVEEFRKRNLHIPLEMIDMLDRKPTSSRNRSHSEHRKELYGRLCQYLDSRRIRNRGQTYIYPELINRLIRSRFPDNVRDYQTVKKVKHGKLIDVSEHDKFYVQWEDFCKQIC